MNCATLRLWFAAFFIAVCAIPVRADGLKSLENFLKTSKSGRAEFTQQVSAPGKAGQIATSKSSSGTFEFLRPDRFRFLYKKPFEQTIVADGKTLWLYDIDLNQVTARQQAQVLGSTPASLIAAASDLATVRREFVLSAEPESEGLDWVLATPKAKDGQLQSVRIGLRGAQLSRLEIVDSFGQKSSIRFAGFESNPDLDEARFKFSPPAGADVIRQ